MAAGMYRWQQDVYKWEMAVYPPSCFLEEELKSRTLFFLAQAESSSPETLSFPHFNAVMCQISSLLHNITHDS